MSLGMELGLGSGDFVLDGDPAPPPQKSGRSPTNFRPMFIVVKRLDGSRCTWHGDRPQPRQFVLYGDPALLSQKGAEPPPQFSAHFYCGQTVGWIKMRHCVRWGPSSPLLKWHSPQFSAHVYRGPGVGLIKTPLGTKVDLGPGHIV